jgi:hypothetical protein
VLIKNTQQTVKQQDIQCDLAKAFDCLNQEILLIKLHFLAFKEQQQLGSDPT